MKLFKSLKGPIRVSSTTGHTVIIDTEFREVHESLWASAYAAGALSTDMEAPTDTSEYLEARIEEQKELDKLEFTRLKEKLKEAFDNPNKYINNHGKLIHRNIISLLGKVVKKEVLDKAWQELVEENS